MNTYLSCRALPFHACRPERRRGGPKAGQVTVASLNRNDRLLQAMWLLGEADRSLFITGRAGTGKSTLLSRFCEITRRSR